MNIQTPLPKLHEAARRYVSEGRRVIPIEPNGKRPLIAKWNDAAFETVGEVDAFWSENPEANIGLIPEDLGWCVIEQDPGGDASALGLPETYEVQSPRGGTHYYFKGSLPPSASKLAPHVDTRGRTSYVLVPPSVVNGRQYSVKADRPMAPLPPEVAARLETKAEPQKTSVAELDLAGNLSAARTMLRDLIRRGDVAIEGRGGNTQTYSVACRVRDFGISEPKMLELLEAEYNPHCKPEWSREELATIVHNAASYSQNEPGAYGSRPAAEVFKQSLTVAEPRTHLKGIGFTELAKRQAKPVPELIPGLIERGIATMLSGPGGTHKSRLALQFGLALQAGASVFGRPVTQCEFWYLDYENGEDEIVRRLHKLSYGLNLPGLEGARYFDFKSPANASTDAIPNYELAPALATVTEEAVTPEPLYFEMYAALRATQGHKFVVLDSTYNVLRFTSQAKINEAAVKAALNLLDHLCAATDSTILYLWHPSRAGMERGDASGWSVAWENTPRARLSISKAENTADAFTLKVEKRNNGPTGDTITLHWHDGTLLPLADMPGNGKGLLDACVELALEAAKNGNPIQLQRKITPPQLAHLERALGFRPSNQDVKDQLQQALLDKRLRYVRGYGKTMAGYYPYALDPVMAATYADDAERERERARLAKAKAGSAEAKDAPDGYGEG